MGLSRANINIVRFAFENINSKSDLLNLINLVPRIASINHNFILNPQETHNSLAIKAIYRNLCEELKSNNKFNISEEQLNYFASSFDNKEKKRYRYKKFYIKKKSGELREILAPIKNLKLIHRCLNNIFKSIYNTQEQAYGFVENKSITDNASLHTGFNYVFNVDIKDFFPSIYFRRIKHMLELPPFNLKGVREPIAYLISNLCTENGVLPQGAPTSPILTNIVCQKLDIKLAKLAKSYKANYSRYADDITFSCNDYIFTKRFLFRLKRILKDERFEINELKTRLHHKSFRQVVTGLTVNEKINVSKRYKKSLRTIKHLYEKRGADAAMEYYLKKLPINLHPQKNILNKDQFIQNVISGKESFNKSVRDHSNSRLNLQEGYLIKKSNYHQLSNNNQLSRANLSGIINETLNLWGKSDNINDFLNAMNYFNNHKNE